MYSDVSSWEGEGGRLFSTLMRNCVKSVVHKRKEVNRPFFYARELQEVMRNDFLVKAKKNYDRRSTISSILPTTVRG